jgi:hypothetical protein
MLLFGRCETELEMEMEIEIEIEIQIQIQMLLFGDLMAPLWPLAIIIVVDANCPVSL